MSITASQAIKVMQSWVGKNEADGSFKEIIDLYNTQKPLPRGYKVKYTDEWCATTISAVSVKLGCTDIMPTECSCQKMIEKYKTIGCFVENENRVPMPGDIIFYDWQDSSNYATTDNKGNADHVGMVEQIVGNTITVIEGNLNSAVGRRKLEVNGKYIRGYAVPKYSTSTTNTVYVPSTNNTTSSVATSSVYYSRYTGKESGLDTILAEIGVPAQYRGSWKARKPLAEANGISNYCGSAKDNSTLKALAKSGKLKRVGATVQNSTQTSTSASASTSTVKYFKKYTGTSGSIVSALNAIGAQSSYAYRAKIAKANNIKLYVGTAKQNSTMVSLLKQGKLIMP